MISLAHCGRNGKIYSLRVFAASVTIAVVFLDLIAAFCPAMCICDIDNVGRKRTRCETSGISMPGDIDVTDFDADVQVIVISGSLERRNNVVLRSDMFTNKWRLQEVHLSYALLDPLPDRVFSSVSATLRVLNLTHNNLRLLTENHFFDLSHLTHLYLDYNYLESFHSLVFWFLPNLEVLSISNNLIRIIQCPSRKDCGAFLPQKGIKLNKLKVLDLSRNPIGNHSQDGENSISEYFFADLPALSVLNLSQCKLNSLPWRALSRDNPELEELDLSLNRISTLETDQMSLIHNLKKLKLAGNPIRHIPAGALGGWFLEDVDLTALPLLMAVEAPAIFQGAHITKLNLANMGLLEINIRLLQPIYQGLTTLNISGNPGLLIKPKMFDFLSALKELIMTRMRISTLPADLFNYANNLEFVDLSENDIVDLDNHLFVPLSSLLRLNLATNLLHRVPAIAGLRKLQNLDLRQNQLTSMPETFLDVVSAPDSTLMSLRLDGNPWNCDCGIVKLGRWLRLNDTNSGFKVVCSSVTCPVCSHPPDLRGTSLAIFAVNETECSSFRKN